jgi:hypothetical protein
MDRAGGADRAGGVERAGGADRAGGVERAGGAGSWFRVRHAPVLSAWKIGVSAASSL